MIVVFVVFSILLAVVITCLAMVYRRQVSIDAPERGFLCVEYWENGDKPVIWFNTDVDPRTFTDGEKIKIKVRVIGTASQGKQSS